MKQDKVKVEGERRLRLRLRGLIFLAT